VDAQQTHDPRRSPRDPIDGVRPGAFFLARVDAQCRRFYERKPPAAL
jgi:hypothetical protein